MYGEIIIPSAVYDEIEVGKKWKYYVDLQHEHWISIQQVKDTFSLDFLLDLDKGEAEVIVLAREIEADLVILDETLARGYAKRFNLPLTGTIGVLLKAKERGLIERVGDLLDQLVAKGVWLSPKIIRQAKEIAKEY